MTPEEASTLRHELRTPVNHIVGYAELLIDDGGLAPGPMATVSVVGELGRDFAAAMDGVFEPGQELSPPSVAALRSRLSALETRAAELPAMAGPAQAADVEKILAATVRLRTMVESLVQGPTPAAGQLEAESVPGPSEPSAPLILVVDDDSPNREVLVRRLARLGYSTTEAGDGLAALERLAEAPPVDLVLLDVMMPGLDGFGVLQRRREDPALRDIPVIMISALDQVESVVRAVEMGADDYLPKPFDPVLLKARVGACLERKRLHDAEKQLLAEVTAQTASLASLNEELERRVADKVAEVERLGALKRFLAPQLAETVLNGDGALLRLHRQEIAVLFCDLRGFTSFSERAEPEDVIAILREMHDAVGPLIFRYEGTLAHFTGDGMMIFFNDPLPCADPALNAVRLALGMRDAAEELAENWKRRGFSLELGIGVDMGYATCGEIGFDWRHEYTAIGTVPNLASRLCGHALGGQVLISSRVHAAVAQSVDVRPLGGIEYKGFARPIATYSVTGMR
jgi:adenylate cyclase